MLRIRLTRIGRTHAPAYRVIVTEKRSKRDGSYVDLLGHYNPSMVPAQLKIDKKKVDEWVAKGAQLSESVKQLLDTGKLVAKKKQKKEKKGE